MTAAEPGLTPCCHPEIHPLPAQGVQQGRRVIASLDLPEFIPVAFYCPMDEHSLLVPVPCIAPTTLQPPPWETTTALVCPSLLPLPSAICAQKGAEPQQTHATHVWPHHLRCTLLAGSGAHHVLSLLAQAVLHTPSPAPCTPEPPGTHRAPFVPLPAAAQLCAHTLLLTRYRRRQQEGLRRVLESCSCSALRATTLLTSPFSVQVCASPLPSPVH